MTELPQSMEPSSPDSAGSGHLPSSSEMAARRKFRHFKVKFARVRIAVGGLSVVAAVLLIFLYLLYDVMPLFRSASMTPVSEFRLSDSDMPPVLHLAVEERREVAMRLGADGIAVFFSTDNGQVISELPLPIPPGQAITSFALDTDVSGIFAVGLSGGSVLVAQYAYDVSYGENNVRNVTPVLRYPFGESAYQLFDGVQVSRLSVRSGTGELLVAGSNEAGVVHLLRASRETNLFSAFSNTAPVWETRTATLSGVVSDIDRLYLGIDRVWLFAVTSSGRVSVIDVRPAFRGEQVTVTDEVRAVDNTRTLTDITFLLGGLSLLVADDGGTVSQWFLVRRNGLTALERVRDFDAESRVTAMSAEQRRKNFIVANSEGGIGIYNTTAERRVAFEQLVDGTPTDIAVSARGDSLLIENSNGSFSFWHVENRHPEVSWGALWHRVWYENYQDPEY